MTMAEDITRVLHEEGRCTLDLIASSTGHKKKSLSSRLYDLKRYGVVNYDEEESVYYLPTIEDPLDDGGSSNGSAPKRPTTLKEERNPISADEEEFQRLLQDCDVRRARDTITRFFFSGDVHKLNNLVEVLEEARGYVNPNSARLILRAWARYIGADFAEVAQMEERLGRPAGGSSKEPDEDHFIQELGWQVVKDRDGDWVTQPGGELSHREALKWAATNNAIRQPRGGGADEEEDEEAPKGRRRKSGGAPEQPSLLDIIKTVKELVVPDNSGKDDEVKILRERLEQMERDRQDDRMARMEEMMAAAMNRNPINDYIQLKAQLNELAPPQSPITDNSPTVQLLKDQTDKFDKGVNRLAGIVERIALRGHDEVLPETRYTEEEREAKASAVIKSLEQGEESRQLRQELFGRSDS